MIHGCVLMLQCVGDDTRGCVAFLTFGGGGNFPLHSSVFFFSYVFCGFSAPCGTSLRVWNGGKKRGTDSYCNVSKSGKSEIIGMKIERRKAAKRSKTDGELVENRKGCRQRLRESG